MASASSTEPSSSFRRLFTLAAVLTGTISIRRPLAATAWARALPKALYGPPSGPVASRSRRTGPELPAHPASAAAPVPSPAAITRRRVNPALITAAA